MSSERHDSVLSPQSSDLSLARRLGPFDATMLVMGGIIGSGIFINPYVVARHVHTPALILLAWIAGGAVALLGAFAYAELASLRPETGGQYAYLRDAYHPSVAFLYGWALLLVMQSGGMAAVAATFAKYTVELTGIPMRDSVLAAISLAVLTLIAAACVHLGLNVGNDVFDTLSGADAANVTPTQFSGGSRVILYGLLTLRQMVLLMLGFYAAAIGIGLFLAAYTAFWPVFWIGVAGVFISVFYTAPPFRFVHRGIGELMVALGFGPIMTMGAYYVQAQRWSWEGFYVSLPVAILIALVLYVNEVPDRPGDAAAGKRTLPVRWSKEAVIGAYVGAVVVAFVLIAGGAIAGVIVRPAILALLAAPLATQVYRGLRDHYESPYQLMPFMGKGVQLHLATGLLLLVGYLIAIVASHLSGHPPVFLR